MGSSGSAQAATWVYSGESTVEDSIIHEASIINLCMRHRVHTEEEARNLWSVVDSAFPLIHNRKTIQLKYQQLFDVFHILTICDFGKNIQPWMQESFSASAKIVLERVLGAKSEKISVFNQQIADYLNLTDKIQKIAIYYDSRYALPKKLWPTIMVGYSCLHDVMASSTALDDIVECILDGLDAKRDKKFTDYLQLRTAVSNLIDLGEKEVVFVKCTESCGLTSEEVKLESSLEFYSSRFEQKYLDRMVLYYSDKIGMRAGNTHASDLCNEIQNT
jgi:hypothetical protein